MRALGRVSYASVCNSLAAVCRGLQTGIADLFGLAGEVNSTGDDQKKLDVLSNDIFINALANCGACAVLVSEENEECIIVDQANAGRYGGCLVGLMCCWAVICRRSSSSICPYATLI